MIPQELLNKRARIAEKKVKVKRRLRATPVTPVRMISCIFPRPVTRINSHPENITLPRNKSEEYLEKPRQLCAFKRLQGHLVENSKRELECPLDLTNTVRGTELGSQAEAKGQSGVNNLHTSPLFPSVPPSSSFSQGATMPVALTLLPSLCSQEVTSTDVRRQAQKVNRARKRLAQALEADMLARQAENMAEWSVHAYSEYK
ncbi:putative methyl-CpG-binding domain protein 3-like 3 [Mesocricetus auratus]|uniref:Methyl-CpG-binding domain protein 3-like 3 n=1 Tax=Mesocricetus auratus TaxID=10036 RepID=A0ABM2X246_MESAU|nr:putative methyl-CpG-binding domain protein 3-like 3 [Mesocricetus auratus]